MKKITTVMFTLLLSVASFAQVGNYEVGDTVDDFTVTDTDGNEWSLYELTAQGKYVYLDFFFANCGPCQQTSRYFNEFHEKYGCNQGNLFMIAINGTGSDSDADVEGFEEQYGGDFNHSPAVSGDGNGGAIGTQFGISAYPTYCLIGPDNILVRNDIWPITDVGSFEATIPAESGAEPMECSLGLGDSSVLNFTMYPNPSNGSVLNLDLPVALESAKVTIYNTLGSVVFTTTINGDRATLNTNLTAGAYLVNVSGENTSNTLMLTVK